MIWNTGKGQNWWFVISRSRVQILVPAPFILYKNNNITYWLTESALHINRIGHQIGHHWKVSKSRKHCQEHYDQSCLFRVFRLFYLLSNPRLDILWVPSHDPVSDRNRSRKLVFGYVSVDCRTWKTRNMSYFRHSNKSQHFWVLGYSLKPRIQTREDVWIKLSRLWVGFYRP